MDRVLAVVVLIALVGMGGMAAVWSADAARLRSDRDRARAELAQMRASVAEQRAEYEAQARAQEAQHRREMDAIGAETQRKLDDAQAAADRTVADLRAGERRLRAHWEGCQATASLSAAAAVAAGSVNDAELRRTGAANLVRLADQCDVQVRGLQRAYGVIAE